MPHFKKTTRFPVNAHTLYQWHARAGAFNRLAPPWERLQVVEQRGSIEDGDVLIFKVSQGPIALEWEAHHEAHEPGRQFRDVQARGPFSEWSHTHRFIPDGDGAILEDAITYKLPLHPLSHFFAGRQVERMIERMFTFRHERTMHDITRHETFADRPRKRIAITGATGLIGGALTSYLTTAGHTVHPISRRDGKNHIVWDIKNGELDASALEGVDAVVHLAGESVNQRWSGPARERILASRVNGTKLLCDTLATLDQKPSVLISGSAVGFYGDRGEEELTEASAPGEGFLADVCQSWEDATRPARDAGIRTAFARTGLVLDPGGGALDAMLTPFKMGVGGKLGSGEQFMAWIAIDDMIAAIEHIIHTDSIEGPVNMVAPNPIRNKVFTDALGAALSRPTLFTVPKFGLELVMGKDAAEEMLLASQRAIPQTLQDHGFSFSYPEIEGALMHLLGKK